MREDRQKDISMRMPSGDNETRMEIEGSEVVIKSLIEH